MTLATMRHTQNSQMINREGHFDVYHKIVVRIPRSDMFTLIDLSFQIPHILQREVKRNCSLFSFNKRENRFTT